VAGIKETAWSGHLSSFHMHESFLCGFLVFPIGKPTASPFSQAASSFFCIFAHFLPAFVYTATQGCAIDSPFAAMHVESKTHAGGLSARFHMQRDLPVSPA